MSNILYIRILAGTTNKLGLVSVSSRFPNTFKIATAIDPTLIMTNPAAYMVSDGFAVNAATKTIDGSTIVDDPNYVA